LNKNPLNRLLSIVVLLFSFHLLATAQFNAGYEFQQLSHLYYKKTKDSLKKAWDCPNVLPTKEAQKIFKETYDGRTLFLSNAIDARAFVYDPEIGKYLADLVKEIGKASPDLILSNPLILIDRSASVNAYALGDNIIAVNLGLITFLQTREELALVLAHELAHNAKKHSYHAMYDRAEWLSSEEYKSSLNSVLDSKYERYTRLKSIVDNVKFDRSRHQRYNESDADSMAIAALRKSDLGFEPGFFLRLDSADLIYQTPLSKPIVDFFYASGVSFDSSWTKSRSKGLSVKAYNFSENKTIADSLKTHPDCIERYNKFKDLAKPVALHPIPAQLKERANKMLIWNIFDDRRLTACIYRVLLEKDKGSTDPWYDFMLFNSFALLNYLDQKLERFQGIAVKPKEYISADYFKLQTALEQIPRDKLKELTLQLGKAPFRSKLSAQENALMTLVSTLALTEGVDDKQKALALKQFNSDYPNSMYREFSEFFQTK
jgi:hypothetical protein